MAFGHYFDVIMETKDRIRMIMEEQHMTQQVFAEFLQQAPATLSSIFNGRTRPTLNIVESIKAKIPDISVEWLLFGIGDMHITHPQSANESASRPQVPASEAMINFDAPLSQAPQSYVSNPVTPVYPRGVKNTRPEYLPEEIKIVDKEPRKVTEIRVYYDDQTYETFVPAKK